MALSAAEKQKRYRERLRERAEDQTQAAELIERMRAAYREAAVLEADRFLGWCGDDTPSDVMAGLEVWRKVFSEGAGVSNEAMVGIMSAAGNRAAFELMGQYYFDNVGNTGRNVTDQRRSA